MPNETQLVASHQSLDNIKFWFSNERIRVHIQPDDSKWFCAADACKILGYKDTDKALKEHCLGEPIKHKPDDALKQLHYVSESNLYNLILRSNSSNAISFRKLVTEKILPAIRECGRIIMTKEVRQQILQEAMETLPVKGEQPEMFPITAKPKLTFPQGAVDTLCFARKKLASEGITFNAYSDFLGYLIEAGLSQMGLKGFEPNRNKECK